MSAQEFARLEYPEITSYIPIKLGLLGITTFQELAKELDLPPELSEEDALIEYLKAMGWAWLSTKIAVIERYKLTTEQIHDQPIELKLVFGHKRRSLTD
jgi:hypothetical protein